MCVCVCVCVSVNIRVLCGMHEMFCVPFLLHKRTATVCDSLSYCSTSAWLVGVVHSLCAFLVVQTAIEPVALGGLHIANKSALNSGRKCSCVFLWPKHTLCNCVVRMILTYVCGKHKVSFLRPCIHTVLEAHSHTRTRIFWLHLIVLFYPV